MTRYAEDSRERVRDAVDLVQLVSARTELRRAGANSYFGRCPFHDERTPSFHVRPDDGHYHCFGCAASGDAFRFVMETEGMGFREALETLAERFGVELQCVDEDPAAAARRARRDRLHALLDRAAAYYARSFWEAAEAAPARDYLAGRGLGEEVLRGFRVGYAPAAWDRLSAASRRAGFSEEELVAAGLAQRSRRAGGRLYDRFRERIIFPLVDRRGRVLGFGARALRADQQPKYLNTSEGEVFHKGRQLFGADRARAVDGELVVVEGYTDVLALHQAGIANSVAIMGTSLTDDQVGELARMASTVTLALDADRAGQEAMLRAARLAERRSVALRVVPWPEGTDPADLVAREGADAMRARLARSMPFVAFRVERVLATADVDSAEGRDRALAELRPVLSTLGPSVLREELVRRAAARLDLSEALVASLARDGAGHARADGARRGSAAAASGPRGPEAAASERAPAPDRRAQTERTYLALCIALPDAGREALDHVRPDEHFTGPLVRRAAEHLREHLGDPMAGLRPGEDDELAALLAELSTRFEGPVSASALELEALQLEQGRVDRQIAAARAEGGRGVPTLARERAEVRTRIDRVSERIDREAG